MRKDVTGLRFGKLVVLAHDKWDKEKRVSLYLCECECGNVKIIPYNSLKTGNTQSCGCMHKEQLKERNTKHGKVNSPIYSVWSGMRDRCNNPLNKSYKNYGARGIKVSQSWCEFENFHNDMIASYLKGYSIERVNNDGNYCAENCIWANSKTQANNNRRNKTITYKGVTDTLSNMSTLFSFDYVVVQSRLYKGWEVDRAIETPETKYKSYEYNGEILSLKDFSIKYNQDYSRLCKRLEKGWSFEKALLTPKTSRQQNQQSNNNL